MRFKLILKKDGKVFGDGTQKMFCIVQTPM